MMHDFGVTQDYAVFSCRANVSSWERLKQACPHFGFDTSLAGLSGRAAAARRRPRPALVQVGRRCSPATS